jgi:hypothetical protein
MFAYRVPLTTTNAPALAVLKGGQNCDFWGLSATNNETSTTIYLKLWWQGNGNVVPVLGVTVPTVTIAIPSSGIYESQTVALIMPGPLYYAVTKLQADTDQTALSTGGEAITLFLE